MNKRKLFTAVLALASVCAGTAKTYEPVDYVSTLVGSESKHSLSTGNTYPAVAMPWGMNFWTPQTGKMGDGWTYTYSADKLRGFKQTHQPSPWINDYGQFAVMPEVGAPVFDEEKRASWFSHKAEVATPYYYRAYLADYDIVTEIAPTERAAIMRVTYPEAEQASFVVDAYDDGSYVKVLPEQNMVVGYTTKNNGGVPENFKNYFVMKFDRPFAYTSVVVNGEIKSGELVSQCNHAGAIVGFKTKRGEQLNVRIASSFISEEQAVENLKELGNDDFDAVKARGRKTWNDVLGKIEVKSHDIDHLRTTAVIAVYGNHVLLAYSDAVLRRIGYCHILILCYITATLDCKNIIDIYFTILIMADRQNKAVYNMRRIAFEGKFLTQPYVRCSPCGGIVGRAV